MPQSSAAQPFSINRKNLMNNTKAQTKHTPPLASMVSTLRATIVGATVAMSLAACDAAKPGAAQIEPYVMEELGQCFLWTISDVRKTDGIEEGNLYRVDFTAKLTLKETPEKAVASYSQLRDVQNNGSCLKYYSILLMMPSDDALAKAMESRTTPPVVLAKQYDVEGAGILVKSEKGWRLRGELDVGTINPVGGAN